VAADCRIVHAGLAWGVLGTAGGRGGVEAPQPVLLLTRLSVLSPKGRPLGPPLAPPQHLLSSL